MKQLLQTLMGEFWDKSWDGFVSRDARFADIKNRIKVAIGMRRSGKTWLMHQVIEGLLGSGVERQRILYINFEDDRLLPASARLASQLLEAFYTLFPENHKKKCFLFFDEIQNVENWPPFLRRVLDSNKVEIYVTGSSAKLLSKEIHTSLRGRTTATEVWPYSFLEYLRSKEITPSGDIATPHERSLLKKELLHYLSHGGFPEAVPLQDPERCQVLQDYVSLVTFRDIVERHEVKNLTLLKHLIRHLLHGVGCPFTINKFYNDKKSQGFHVAKDTLYDYLSYLEDAYLVFPISLHSTSERQRQVNPKKIYAIDPGLVLASSFQQGENFGSLFENLVFLDLRRKSCHVDYYVTSSGHEIDFVARFPNGCTRLIQACYDTASPDTLNRETRALNEAMQELKTDGLLVTPDNYMEFLREV